MTRQLQPGERAPDFAGARSAGQPARFYAFAGGVPAALVFASRSDETTIRLAAALAAASCTAYWVVRDESAVPDGVTGWLDADGAIAAAYGVEATPTVFALDANVRLLDASTGTDPQRVTALLKRAALDGPADIVTGQAPVMLVPDVVPEPLRHKLIAQWESSGSEDTGVERTGATGRLESLDDEVKRRRDHTVTDNELMKELSQTVGRRLMPELQKAFAYRATRFEGFKIACYDATTGGFFRPHRDNLSPTTAHRAFGLTINLNDEYEGGELRFPEYGNQRYRPAAGTALVFSSSHLHEATDVTAGRRFVLLSFLYAADAATRPAN